MKYFILNLTFMWLLLFACGYHVSAQNKDDIFPPSENPIEFKPTKIKGHLKIDGILNEPSYNKAVNYSNFVTVEPIQGEQTAFPTSVKILYDEHYIYIGVVCYDSIASNGVRVSNLERDFSWGSNDIFGVVFDPFNTQQVATTFQTTPYGNQRDMQVFNGQLFDADYDALWKVRTQINKDNWTAEFAIPFKSLRYPKSKVEDFIWHMSFVRRSRRTNEISALPAYPRAFSPYRPIYAGVINAMEVPSPATNIRIQPYALNNYNRSLENDEQTVQDNDVKLGGEIKWAITPQSVLDFTVNTDFAQVDVDRAVQNLTRFSIFFPERRQFFLENSGIFKLDNGNILNPFFSRSIGLDNNGSPLQIDIGARFVSRNSKRNIGGLLMSQNKFNGELGSYFGVFRYEHQYSKQDNLGILVTNRYNENTISLNAKNNTTVSISGFNRPSESLTLSYFLTNSLDKIEGENINSGMGGRFAIGYNTNQFYIGSVNYYISEKYDPAMGFLIGRNLLFHNPGGYLNWRPKWRPSFIRAFEPGFWVNMYQNASSFELIENSIQIYPIYIRFQDDTRLQFTIEPTWQNVQSDFSPLGINVGKGTYQYNRYRLYISTDPSRKYSGILTAETGGYFDGNLEVIKANLRVAPIPHIELEGGLALNRIRGLGNNSEDKNARLFTMSSRFSLNPRVHLTGFYQFNSESISAQHLWNIRLVWEYQPLSFLYLVFNQFSGEQHIDMTNREQQVIGKISFTRQF